MKKSMKFVLAAGLLSLVACSGAGGGTDDGKIPSTNDTLVVDLHTFMPTGGGASADAASITATQDIADDFYEATGIRIRWFTGKTLDGNADAVSSDYIKAIQNGTMPAIGFSWSNFTDRGYYLDLSEYLDTPNEFLSEEDRALYPTWKDQFPSYLWDLKECNDGNGHIISIPTFLSPGPDTGWFYNKTAFTARGYDTPTTWNEFRALAQEIQSPTAGPFVFEQSVKIDGWEMQFSLGPVFAEMLKDVVDTNQDGKISTEETLLGVEAGYYSPLESENPNHYFIAQALFAMLKDYYTKILPENWKTADSTRAWSNGTAMLRQNGLWSVRSEKGADKTRDWEHGVFPSPIVSSDSASFLQSKGLGKAASLLTPVKTIQVPEKENYGPAELQDAFIELYQPRPTGYYNLMKHGIYGNKTVLENAVKFLKFMSTPENVTRVSQDHQAILGGVSGSVPGVTLMDWLQGVFPVLPNAIWPSGYVLSNIQNISSALNKWVAGTMADEEFYAKYSAELKAGAASYKEAAFGA